MNDDEIYRYSIDRELTRYLGGQCLAPQRQFINAALEFGARTLELIVFGCRGLCGGGETVGGRLLLRYGLRPMSDRSKI